MSSSDVACVRYNRNELGQVTMTSRRKFWGWGYADSILPMQEQRRIGQTWAPRFGIQGFEVTPPPRAEEIDLRRPCFVIPSCGARRMAETAAHLVDQVIPRVAVRQWPV